MYLSARERCDLGYRYDRKATITLNPLVNPGNKCSRNSPRRSVALPNLMKYNMLLLTITLLDLYKNTTFTDSYC